MRVETAGRAGARTAVAQQQRAAYGGQHQDRGRRPRRGPPPPDRPALPARHASGRRDAAPEPARDAGPARRGQEVEELLGALRPVGRHLGEDREDRLLDLLGHGVPHQPEAGHRLHRVARHDRARVGAGERRLARQHLERHAAERVQVGGRPDGVAHRLLGAHVGRRADRHAGLRELLAGLGGGARDAEVGHQGVAAREQDVLRLDVAVDDAEGVGRAERVRHLVGDLQRVVHRQHGLARDAVAQRLARDERHHVVEEAVRLAGIEQAEDVRMVELGGELDLSLEPLGAHRGRQLGVQHLDGDVALVPEVVREEDGGHAAGAQLALDAVAIPQRVLQLLEGAGVGLGLDAGRRAALHAERGPRKEGRTALGDRRLARSGWSRKWD